jgi:hypothetical protein
MSRESLSADCVSKYPAQFAFLLFFAALGGLKVYRDLVSVSNGAVMLGEIATDYASAIVGTVTFVLVMKWKVKRQRNDF